MIKEGRNDIGSSIDQLDMLRWDSRDKTYAGSMLH